MAANNRATARAPGRTPPFILVGLVVLVAILGYNYWSLSSANSVLSSDLDVVRIEKKSVSDKLAELEKNMEATHEDLRRTEGILAQTRQQQEDKEKELNNLKADYTKIEGDTKALQENLDHCDKDLMMKQKDLDSVKVEKDTLQQTLDEERQKPGNCDFGSCTSHVKLIIAMVSKTTGSDAMKKLLESNGLDAGILMEGLDYVAPPNPPQNQQVNQPATQGDQNQVLPQQGDSNQKQLDANQNQLQPQVEQGQLAQNQQNDNQVQQPAGNADNTKDEVDNKVKEMSIDAPPQDVKPAEKDSKDSPDTLKFESHMDEKAKIVKYVQEEIEKANEKDDKGPEKDNAGTDKNYDVPGDDGDEVNTATGKVENDLPDKNNEKNLSYDDYDGTAKDEDDDDKEANEAEDDDRLP